MKRFLLLALLLLTPAFASQPTEEEALAIFYNVGRVRTYVKSTYEPVGVGFDAAMVSVHPVTLGELKVRLMMSDEELEDVLFYDDRLFVYHVIKPDGTVSKALYVGIRWRERMRA